MTATNEQSFKYNNTFNFDNYLPFAAIHPIYWISNEKKNVLTLLN